MKILCVEDDDANADEIIAALRTENNALREELAARGVSYNLPGEDDILRARSLKRALELLDSAVGLILLDLYILHTEDDKSLPAKDVLHGFEILKKARSLSPSPDVIVISSSARPKAPGLTQFQIALQQADQSLIPDDFLWKEECRDSDFLQRKIASFLIDLSTDDEERLREHGILVPPAGMPSRVRDALRLLKRLAYSAERQQPLPDVVLSGEPGSGRSMLARAFHLLRPRPRGRRLGFEQVDLLSIQEGGGDAVEALIGSSGGADWTLGALPRNTYYTRSSAWIRLPGQVVGDGVERQVMQGIANVRLYPASSDVPDFDASGTLYLAGFDALKPAVIKQIEMILSPDLYRRYVTTRGSIPTRLHVGASIVRSGGASRSRLGEVVIDVPPVREMKLDERAWLLEELVSLRRIRAGAIGDLRRAELNKNVLGILESELSFKNNIDDLQGIANTVLPEESSITWRHLREAWEREHIRASQESSVPGVP